MKKPEKEIQKIKLGTQLNEEIKEKLEKLRSLYGEKLTEQPADIKENS